MLLLMIDYLRSPVVHEAFFKKYASKKFLKGKLYTPINDYLCVEKHCSDCYSASIVLRAWAKKWAPYYLGEDATTKSAKQT